MAWRFSYMGQTNEGIAREDVERADADLARKKADGRGRKAERPSQFPAVAWKDILGRVWQQATEDRIMLVAAGVSFYLLLALFPTLAAFVSIYGFVADPVTVADHVAFLGGLMPRGGLDLIRSQLENLASQDREALSIGFLVAILAAFWSANNGVKTLFQALNIAYEEHEKRSFIHLNLVALAFTLGSIGIAIIMIVAVGVVPAALGLLQVEAFSETIIGLLRWPVLLVLVATGISILYRFGPSRERAKWRWITWGGGLATLVWIVASAGFSFYLQNFADYNATYGSLGAVVGLMFWLWISIMILMVGAELNAEMEHQTAVDSTTGTPSPMGERGAVVADTLGDKVR
jgi:membrane protein